MTTPDVQPAPLAPTGPVCGLCGTPALVHWQRRLTGAEVAEQQAIEQGRRDEVVLLADPALPPPVFPPMPGFEDATRIVHGCIHHAITQDTAALTHQATCTAPTEADLPGCNCTPETAPTPDPEPPTPQLPPGWN
ncbi:hypothetical protein ABZX65_26665 [Streptomyces sp. NPDC003300]|uniref:hypothetical protein n=1 Tax=unclassified Streptomyces TaxID=2593676 RepID=UPI0033BC0F8D